MFDTIAAVLGIPDMPGVPELYVASVEGGYMGSGVNTYHGFQEQAAERIGGDSFLLPSLIQEVQSAWKQQNGIDGHGTWQGARSQRRWRLVLGRQALP